MKEGLLNGVLNRPSVNSETALLSVELRVISEPIEVMDVWPHEDEIEFFLFKSDDEESFNEFFLFKSDDEESFLFKSEIEESCIDESDSSNLLSLDGPSISNGGLFCC